VAREHGFGRVREVSTRSADALAAEIAAEFVTRPFAEVTR
jgi:hypothetical protein